MKTAGDWQHCCQAAQASRGERSRRFLREAAEAGRKEGLPRMDSKGGTRQNRQLRVRGTERSSFR